MTFASVLTLIFITLKLTGLIAWSWLWVLAPLWIGAVFTLMVLILAFLVACLVGSKVKSRRW